MAGVSNTMPNFKLPFKILPSAPPCRVQAAGWPEMEARETSHANAAPAQPNALAAEKHIPGNPQCSSQGFEVNKESSVMMSQFGKEGALKSCYRCLSPLHLVKDCNNPVRCRHCYYYGHIEKWCNKRKAKTTRQWRAKQGQLPRHDTAQSAQHDTQDSELNSGQPQPARSPSEKAVTLICAPSPPFAHSASQLIVWSPTMANFPVDPHRFIPQHMEIEDGGANRIPRAFVNLSGAPARNFEEYVIAEDVDELLDHGDYAVFVHQIRQFLVDELHVPVRFACIHPLGIGLFQLDSVFHRDALFAANPHEIDGIRVRFVRHYQGINRRDKDYTRYGWIMILGFPLEYRSLEHVDQAVSSFGKMLRWRNPPNRLGYVLVKCLYNEPQSVPRSLVFRQGTRQGSGWSWSAPVFILNWEHPDELFPEHDELPADGNPHPLPAQPDDEEGAHIQAMVDQHFNQGIGDPNWDQHIQQ